MVATKKKASEPLKKELKRVKISLSHQEANETSLVIKKKSDCYSGTNPCTSTSSFSLKPNVTTYPGATTQHSHDKNDKKSPKTRILVKYDAGFGNNLTLRGKNAGLSWLKGIPLKNISSNEWIWETNEFFASGEFKVLINDIHYESGCNHTIFYGANIEYTPNF